MVTLRSAVGLMAMSQVDVNGSSIENWTDGGEDHGDE